MCQGFLFSVGIGCYSFFIIGIFIVALCGSECHFLFCWVCVSVGVGFYGHVAVGVTFYLGGVCGSWVWCGSWCDFLWCSGVQACGSGCGFPCLWLCNNCQ